MVKKFQAIDPTCPIHGDRMIRIVSCGKAFCPVCGIEEDNVSHIITQGEMMNRIGMPIERRVINFSAFTGEEKQN